jgi:hypothetical protein
MTPLQPDVIEKIISAIMDKVHRNGTTNSSGRDLLIGIYKSDLRAALESVEVEQVIKHLYGPTDGLPIELNAINPHLNAAWYFARKHRYVKNISGRCLLKKNYP